MSTVLLFDIRLLLFRNMPDTIQNPRLINVPVNVVSAIIASLLSLYFNRRITDHLCFHISVSVLLRGCIEIDLDRCSTILSNAPTFKMKRKQVVH